MKRQAGAPEACMWDEKINIVCVVLSQSSVWMWYCGTCGQIL